MEHGTTNVEPVNDPVELVTVVPVSVTVWPANVAASVQGPVQVPAKPEPETAMLCPTNPATGFRAIAGVTVNVVAAVVAPPVAVIVLEPAVEDGTTKVATKVPLEVDVVVVTVLEIVHALFWQYVTVIGEDAGYPEPVNVTDVPTTPVLGDAVTEAMRLVPDHKVVEYGRFWP